MEGRERISAAVILIIFLIGAIVIYLVMIPQPVAYNLLFGNFSQSSGSTPPPPPTPLGSFYTPLSSYIGGNPTVFNTTYSLGTFAVSYSRVNSTVGGSSPFSLTSSIFGSSSSSIGFYGTPSDAYFLTINLSSVSGSPKLVASLNGNDFYNTLPPSNEIITLKLPNVNNGKNIVSVTNNLNGFAFTQGIDFNNISITQMASLNSSKTLTASIPTLSGLGNFYMQYTPIGYGNLSISANGYDLARISNGTDTPTTILLPPSVVNSAVGSGTSAILPATFNLGFVVEPATTYEIANTGIVYQTPVITVNSPTVQYSIKETDGEYVMILYVNSIIKQGNVTFGFYPSGKTYQISAANLATGENIIILSNASLAGQTINGNYTGTVTMSSNGLIIPQYLSIKPTS
jgi:hypothetical protein